jgi:branched-chain amino acid transport system permease protein
MNWSLIFFNSVYTAISAASAGYCLIAMGLNVHAGYTGLLNFGQAGFAAVGAYALAIPIVEFNWPWWLALMAVFAGGVIFALLLGIPTLRLRSDYLAIVTIAAAEIIRILMRSVRFTWLTGGSDGINGFTGFLEDWNNKYFFGGARYRFGAQTIDGYRLFMLLLGWLLVAVISYFLYRLMRSPWGRVLRSIREDEDAARSLGKNVFAFKMQSLVLGGVIGSLGGVIFATQQQSAQSDQFRTNLTFFAYTIVVLGGLAKILGPIVGTLLFWFVIQLTDNLLDQATRIEALPTWLVDSGNYAQVKFIVAGIALSLLVVFRPQGVFGDRREQAFDVR